MRRSLLQCSVDNSLRFSLTLDSEYESCPSDFDGQTDGEEHEESGGMSSAPPCLSRTDSGVSFQTSSNQRIDRSTAAERKKRQTYFSTSSASTPVSHPPSTGKSHSTSIISAIFDGFIQSEIECLTCCRRSTMIETFQDLSLPLPSREQVEVRPLSSLLPSLSPSLFDPLD